MATAPSSPSAKSPSPDPRITPMTGASTIFSRTKSAASFSFWSIVEASLALEDARDRRAHERGERAGEERPEPEPRDVALARRRESPDAADLDADRREVREAAER